MTKDKSFTTTVDIMPVTNVPSLENYTMKGDPYDPTSRDRFKPAYVRLNKEGKWNIKTIDNNKQAHEKLEVIFLTKIWDLACECSPIEDFKKTVCRSDCKRSVSSTGYRCKTECPYDNKAKFKRPLSRSMFLLIREVGSKGPFTLARFKSRLEAVEELEVIKNVCLKKIGSFKIPSLAKYSFIIPVTEVNGAAVFLAKQIEIAAEVPDEMAKQIGALNQELLDFINQIETARTAKYTEAVEKRAAGLIAAAGSSPVNVSVSALSTSTPSASTPNSDSAAHSPLPVGIEDIVGESEDGTEDIDAEDDDEIPF